MHTMHVLRKENANRKFNVQWFCKGKSYDQLYERDDLFKQCEYFHKEGMQVDGADLRMKR